MFTLDGAALDMDGKQFTYEVPAPFGPNRGKAVLNITARPAATVNSAYQASVDKTIHTANVRDLVTKKNFDQSDDVDAYVTDSSNSKRWAQKAAAETFYDHCIIEWSTTIQNDGKDMEPTRENYIALSLFEHPVIDVLFSEIRDDLRNFEKFSLDAVAEADGEEEKN